VIIVLLIAVAWLVGCALVVAFVAGAARGAARVGAAADVLAEAERIIEAAS